jgi:hypothetical protein
MTEEEIGELLSNFLREEIDREIIREIEINHLVSCGWTKVSLDHPFPSDVDAWVRDNVQGGSRRYHSTWLFESSEDAVLFKLRWDDCTLF